MVLHYNGHEWAMAAQANMSSYGKGQRIAADGSAGHRRPFGGVHPRHQAGAGRRLHQRPGQPDRQRGRRGPSVRLS